MAYLSKATFSFFAIIYCYRFAIFVDASAGVLAKEFCRRDVLDIDDEAQAVITSIFPIRLSAYGHREQKTSLEEDGVRKRYKPPDRHFTRLPKPTENLVPKSAKRKYCGNVSKSGLQNLLAVEWAANILNFQSGEVYGTIVNESFIPGIKIGFRVYDTCGLENVAVSHVLDAYADFYAPSQTCLFNKTTVNAGAIFGELNEQDLREATGYLKQYSQPVVIQSAVPGSLENDLEEGNLFSTLPTISTLAAAMARLAREFGWSRAAIVHENSPYGREGKKQLLKAAKEHEICISDAFELQYHDNVEERRSSFDGATKAIEKLVERLVDNLPHAPAVFVFASDSSVVQLLEDVTNSSRSKKTSEIVWILSNFIKESSRFSALHSMRGLYALAPDLPADIPEFRDYWRVINARKTDNAWLKEYYQLTVGCRFSDELRPNLVALPVCPNEATFSLGEADGDIVVDPYVATAVDGVYAYAVALRKAWESKCGGRPGICPQLIYMTHEEYLDIVRNVEFTYDAAMRSPSSLVGRRISFRTPGVGAVAIYELVEQENQLMFMEAFVYERDRLRLVTKPVFYNTDGSTSFDPPASKCANVDGADCNICLNVPSANSVVPVFKSGDLILAGIFPIHSSMDENGGGGYACGPLRTKDGYQLAEAFWYALSKVNDKSNASFSSVLRGVTLGSLAMDSCNNPPRAAYLMAGVADGNLAESSPAPFRQQRDVIGVVGEFSDRVSIEVAAVLRFVGLTQLSYGAKSLALADANAYPALLRTVVSDATRLKMTSAVLRQLEWDYVQIVASDSEYGRQMSRAFLEAAESICVAHKSTIFSNLTNVREVVNAMQNKSAANAVIIFAEKREIRALLEELKRTETAKGHRFVLIVPDHWYNDPEMFKGVESVVDGALTFAARRLANQQFQKYIASRSANDTDRNQWLIEYIETSLHCNFPGTGTRQYSAACNPGATLGHIPQFRADISSNDVINAVYSFAFGLDAMLRKYCGAQYNGLCTAFKTLPNRNTLLLEFVRKVTFEDETGRVFAFSENMDAATPVAVLQIRKQTDKRGLAPTLQYMQAGLFSTLDKSNSTSFLHASTIRYLHELTSPSSCSADTNVNCFECKHDIYNARRESHSSFAATPSSSHVVQPTASGRIRTEETRAASKSKSVDVVERDTPILYTSSPDKILIGGLFAVHSKDGQFKCGPLIEDGVLMVEAFLWAVDAVNGNSDSVKFRLGAMIFDTCLTAGRAYDELNNFYFKNYNSTDVDEIVAFIGDARDDETVLTTAELLSSMNVTNVFSNTASLLLDDQETFPYTLRATTPVSVQITAVIQLFERMNWTYASVIYSSKRWGYEAYLRFKSEAGDRGICVSLSESMRATDPPQRHDRLVSTLKSKISNDGEDNARVVVLILDIEEASAFLKAVGRAQENRLIFIGAATWGDHVPFTEGEEQSALGSLVLQHDSRPVEAFGAYISSLRYESNERNPWWRDYWRQKFNCTDDETCRHFSLSENDFRNAGAYTNVMNAVWSVSVGLNNLCGSSPTAKRRQQQEKRDGVSSCLDVQKTVDFKRRLFENVKSAGFARVDDAAGESFRFTSKGYSDGGLYILNLIRDQENAALEYKAVGRYLENSSLSLTETPYGYENGGKAVPFSEIKSSCGDTKKCPQCFRWKSASYTTPEPIPTPKVFSTSQPVTYPPDETAAIVSRGQDTYGVVRLNSTYEDAFLYAPSSPEDSHLIVVAFPIHGRDVTGQPLTCGRLQMEHYQNMEAFLWSLKAIHADDQLLPGVQLGALVLDTCSDVTKGVRDLSNFLSGQVTFRTSTGDRIDPNRTIAVVTSPVTEEALPLAHTLSAYGIPNLSPGMSASMITLADAYRDDFTLRTSVPTDVQARALASLLNKIGWSTVSVLFTDNLWGANGQADFRTEAEQRGICIVVSETVPESDDSHCSDFSAKIDETITRFLAVKKVGVHGVIAWLNEKSLRCLLQGLKRATDRGQMKPGDLTLFLSADISDLNTIITDEFERESTGFVALQYGSTVVESFKEYWQKIVLSNDVGEHFWSKEFQQRSTKKSISDAYRQNAYLLNTINAVFSVAVGLEQLRRRMCAEGSNALCPTMVNNAKFKHLLYESIRGVDFEDITGKKVQFAHNSFANQPLGIVNFVKKEQGVEIRQIGIYENDHLKLRQPPQGFDGHHQNVFHLRDRPSKCAAVESRFCSSCYQNRHFNTAGFDSTTIAASTSMFGIPATTDGLATTDYTTTFSETTIDPWKKLTMQNESSTDDNDPVSGHGTKYWSPMPLAPPAPIVVGSNRVAKDLIILPASRRFSLLGIFSVHKRGSNALSCERFNPLNGFQRLAAFLYAVNEVNRDPYVLPGIELGAVAIDDCSSEERAFADVYEILSTPRENGGSAVEDLLAVIGLDYSNGGVEVDRFFRGLSIPLVNSAPTPLVLRDHPLTLGTVPPDDVYVKIVADIFRQMKWTYYSVVYESSSIFFETTSKYFERTMATRGACLAKSLSLNADVTLDDAQLAIRQLVVATGSKAVALFLSDRNILQLMKAVVAEHVPTGRFVFVTKYNDDWAVDADFLLPLQRFGQGLVTVELQRRNSTNFANFLSSMTLENHAPFPTPWFEDFWQHTFQCVLQSGTSPNYQFTTPCTGNERFTPSSFVQGAGVLPTILAVQTVARGLHRFLMQNCPSRTVDTLEACVSQLPKSADDARAQFLKAVRATNFTYAYEAKKEPVWVNFEAGAGFVDAEYSVRNLIRQSDGDFRAHEVGVWRSRSGLILDNAQIVIYDSLGERRTPASVCNGDLCAAQCSASPFASSAGGQNGSVFTSPTPSIGPSSSLYFNSVWGVVVAAVAALGMLTCIICIIYFLVTFPVSYGTTILGYMILFGLIVLYALAFAYVVAPTSISCSVRRFCTGICWAFVFAPMLIKVVHTWHMRSVLGKQQNRLLKQTSPCALFSFALGIVCVQIVIAIEWVILQSPDGVIYVSTLRGEPLAVGGVWRCGPGEQFETAIVVSTVYVMFLIFLTTVFSLLTWNVDEHNRESRWIFVASVMSIAIWLAWTLLATRSEYKVRDPAIAIGIVVNATAVLLCLYLRKAYLYSKYRREAKEVMFDTQSAVYLTSTLGGGGQLMLDNTAMYDSKMITLSGNGNHYVQSSSAPGSVNPMMIQRMALPPTSASAVTLNGTSNGHVESRTIFYQNSAFEGACEFNPGGRTSAPNGLAIYPTNGNGAHPTPAQRNHRF